MRAYQYAFRGSELGSPYGVEGLNRTIEKILREEGLINGAQNAYPACRFLLRRTNNPLRLYNGDIGILLPDPADSSHLLAWFAGEDGGLRRIPAARLPEHEPAFAMTVHKSQGSEFDTVLLILPDKESPLLTRELIYTGLTRARNRVELWFQESVLRAARPPKLGVDPVSAIGYVKHSVQRLAIWRASFEVCAECSGLSKIVD